MRKKGDGNQYSEMIILNGKAILISNNIPYNDNNFYQAKSNLIQFFP